MGHPSSWAEILRKRYLGREVTWAPIYLASAVDAMLVASCRRLGWVWVWLPKGLAKVLGTGTVWVAVAGTAEDVCAPGLPAPALLGASSSLPVGLPGPEASVRPSPG